MDDLKTDRRSLAEKAHDTATSQRNLAGSKADPYLEKAIGKTQEVKEEAKGWFGKSENAADVAARKVEEEKLAAERKAGELKRAAEQKGQEIKQEVSRLLGAEVLASASRLAVC